MSKEKLREAIAYIECVHIDGPSWEEKENAMKIILAAARAYACERCEGTGTIVDDWWLGYTTCPDCKESRKIADGGE